MPSPSSTPPHLLPCLHPPQCSFSRCSSFVSKALLLSPSCQNHQLGGVQSVLMLSQQLPKCNNYSFFFFSSNVRRQSGGWGWWWKRGCTVKAREYPAIWQRKRTHSESVSWIKVVFWKYCCGCQEMQRWYLLSFSLSLFLLVRRGPEYFSSLMDARAVTLPWLYYRTPSYLLWPGRGRQAAAFSLAQQTEALLVNEPERLGSVDGCLSSAGAYCNSSPLAARACVSLLC